MGGGGGVVIIIYFLVLHASLLCRPSGLYKYLFWNVAQVSEPQRSMIYDPYLSAVAKKLVKYFISAKFTQKTMLSRVS